MEDLALLDLLECPVCFERLDVTAKVLPCQHTFCKPCLQRIQRARKELRCPECRSPVSCGIEELPANLLLVRLLDGLRNGQGCLEPVLGKRQTMFNNQDFFTKANDLRSLHGNQHKMIQNAKITGVICAKALYDYGGQMPGDLRFKTGDIIILHRQVDDNWYHGEINGVSGIFPASFVQVIRHLPQSPPPLCKALYNFDLKDKDENENKDCLTFLKDDIIMVIRRVDENWAEGMLGDKVGIFPVSFVEMNSVAKQLLEIKNTCNTLHSGKDDSLGSTFSTTNSSTCLKIPSVSKKRQTQCSTTKALNTLNRSTQSMMERKSLEISAPVLISSSNPAVAARFNEGREQPSSNSTIQIRPHANTSVNPGHPLNTTATVNVCIASQPYTPCKTEELELKKGEAFRVYGKAKEGWLTGVSLVTGKTGILPSSCVTPILRKPFRVTESKIPSPSIPRSGRESAVLSPTSSTILQERLPISGANAVTQPCDNYPLTTAASLTETVGRKLTQHSFSISQIGPAQHRSTQLGGPVQFHTTVRRSASAIVQPQQFHPSLHPHSGSFSTVMRCGQHSLPTWHGSRMTETKTPTSTNPVTAEAKVSPANNEAVSKSNPTAPTSILVKPDAAKNNAEKLVKTVRFQNHSPPPSKRQSLQLSMNAQSVRPGQTTNTEPSFQETRVPETTSIYHSRTGSCPVGTDGRRIHQWKTGSLDLSFHHANLNLQHNLAMNQNLIGSQTIKRHKAVDPYLALGESELDFKTAGNMLIQRKCQDGWLKGNNESCGKTIFFPCSFVKCVE
ncbi:E3 ubiquitin-protein ligase SH3RF2 [Latimeria chalumnae]|uniref:RING-type E3 ubiquitin transferase n=1 Tax=Latimeria chalumnae TaxID=7897 RepID=M3XKP5_LATCH|nr:PREDICTED: putative E3 ubiquitin-protein ligase SH3RF2 [Latimeria chalumnae]|eukprot:XP_005996156.1 PREDICTED: putative E3 ubiquitin-protein ligase SH3RF2 [Latimeria chalumnae]